jgi:hypothetical protein
MRNRHAHTSNKKKAVSGNKKKRDKELHATRM